MKIKKRHLFVSFLFYIKEWYIIMISIFKKLKKNILNNIYTLKDITFDIEDYSEMNLIDDYEYNKLKLLISEQNDITIVNSYNTNNYLLLKELISKKSYSLKKIYRLVIDYRIDNKISRNDFKHLLKEIEKQYV